MAVTPKTCAQNKTVSRQQVLADFELVCLSRHMSLIGRREVLSGKAKFGIFGDGKEVVQVAMAHAFQPGDFRSGYYRDQTLILALQGTDLVTEFFAQLYAHSNVDNDPATGGRTMNAHFATRSLKEDGTWRNLTTCFNSAADISPTGSQMPRLVGLGYASVLYRQMESLAQFSNFSNQGNEIAWGTIGNAATAEGMFWESLNAIGVLQAPVLITVYDDEYGISVPNKYQLTKSDLSSLLEGFKRQPGSSEGFNLYTAAGWDYASMLEVFQTAAETTRRGHIPSLVHVTDLTQPLGHSTSGSHQRYKPADRLAWEEEFDAQRKFRQWITDLGLAESEELDQIDQDARQFVETCRQEAWDAFQEPILKDRQTVLELITQAGMNANKIEQISQITKKLIKLPNPLRRDLTKAAQQALLYLRDEPQQSRQELASWLDDWTTAQRERYGAYLYSRSSQSPLLVPEIKAQYAEEPKKIYGFEILGKCFEQAFQREPRLIAFGEDVGLLGDVNQGFRGLQKKFGPLRVTDTGIREVTILGQAIGLAMRGLRPISEIQYLDYLLYALQIMSDDLATLHWRTKGGQKAPVIVRTRGHRLEGVWHSGSPMAALIHTLRGMHILVPRNMTQAAGFYNTLLLGDDPGLVIEVLNAYRLRENLPQNIGSFTVPLGVPEILLSGEDITLVTYGACCRIVLEAAEKLVETGIQAEVIDVQSLLPFDRHGMILDSLKKTNRIVFIDEDGPGGGSAYMLQEVIEKQNGYHWLDSAPRTVSAQPHRPAYGSDGDYWSKPNVESIFQVVYNLMREAKPNRFPKIFAG